MNCLKKIVAAAFVLTAISFVPGDAFASGNMSIILNANSMDLKGDFGKEWDESLDEDHMDVSENSFRLSFEGELYNRFLIGVDLSYFGRFKFENTSTPLLNQNDIYAVSEYAKFNLIDIPLSGEDNRLQIYAKAGVGQYYWNFKTKYKVSSTIYNDSAHEVMFGYNYGAGLNFIISKSLILGAEYRYDATTSDFKGKGTYRTYEDKAFKASQIGVNVGYRFGGSSSNNNKGDTAALTNMLDNTAAAVNDDAKPVVNNVSGTVADKTVQTDAALDTKKRISGAGATKPAAFNPSPNAIEIDKDIYLGNMDKIWETGAANGKIGIPSMGVLFKIGSSKILPYYNEMLNDFIDLYKQTDGKAVILIEGFSSNGGSETDKNPNLSQQRAKAVAQYFIKNDIPKENLEVKAYSNSKVASGMFAGSKGCKGGQCYRRVNVIIK